MSEEDQERAIDSCLTLYQGVDPENSTSTVIQNTPEQKSKAERCLLIAKPFFEMFESYQDRHYFFQKMLQMPEDFFGLFQLLLPHLSEIGNGDELEAIIHALKCYHKDHWQHLVKLFVSLYKGVLKHKTKGYDLNEEQAKSVLQIAPDFLITINQFLEMIEPSLIQITDPLTRVRLFLHFTFAQNLFGKSLRPKSLWKSLVRGS